MLVRIPKDKMYFLDCIKKLEEEGLIRVLNDSSNNYYIFLKNEDLGKYCLLLDPNDPMCEIRTDGASKIISKILNQRLRYLIPSKIIKKGCNECLKTSKNCVLLDVWLENLPSATVINELSIKTLVKLFGGLMVFSGILYEIFEK